MRYEEMKPGEIELVLQSCPLAYLVWGALEWHAVHNPVGLDSLKAYYMARELCKSTGGVLLPPVYCGYQTMKPWEHFNHTFEFSKNLVRQYVYEYLENLYANGFRVIVLIMGHYGSKHVETVRAGVTDFTEKHKYPKVLAITDYEPASWVSVKGGDHGGQNETSLMMYFRPELVDLSLLPEGDLDPQREGCSATAKEATSAHGQMLVETFLAQAVPKIKELLESAMAQWPKNRIVSPL